MESWFFVCVTLSISALLYSIFNYFFASKKSTHSLPPGPFTFPIIGNFLWLRMSFFQLEPILRSLHAKLGPMVTLQIGSRPAIFVADRSLAHQALVQNGAVFADRPPALTTGKLSSKNKIHTAPYGPTWRLLRRNLTSEILHPSRVKSYSHARKWVLQILHNCLQSKADSGHPVCVIDHFQHAMFCLLVLMCFGDKLSENQIKQIEEAQRQMLVNLSKFHILNFWPRVTKILFRKRWEKFYQFRQSLENVLVPLIRARRKVKEERIKKSNEDNKDSKDDYVVSYVDTLLAIQLLGEKRNLDEEDIMNLSSEFINAGTDSTVTALEWIMANIVKYPQIQEKLFVEIRGVVGIGQEQVKEEDLQKMPYLKAVILEGLRRHPPARLLLYHAVSEDFVLDKYMVPKNGTINFMVADMGWDPKVWEDPMAFKPERFINNNGGKEGAFDVTGSKEIKMMPFGVGRRMCPGYGLAMLHLEYFVANLIWNFEWKCVDGEDVDLTEKEEFTVMMKNPLKACIFTRVK